MYSVHNSSLTSPNTPHGHLLAYWESMKDRSNESNLECSVKLLQTSKLIGVSNQQLSLHLGVPRRSNSKCKIWMHKRSMHSKCHVDSSDYGKWGTHIWGSTTCPPKPSGNPWWRGTPHPDPYSPQPGLRRVGPKSPMQSPSTPIISPYGHGPYVSLGVGTFCFCCIFFWQKIREGNPVCVFFGILSFFLMCCLGKIILYIKIPSPLKLNSSPLKIGSKIGTPPKGK